MTVTGLSLLVLALLGGPQETPAALRAKMANDSDPVRKARLALRIAETELEKARKQYSEGFPEEGLKNLQEMHRLIEQAYTGLAETNRDPRKRPGGFKDMEIKLRVFYRRLDDLRASLPLDERGPIEEMLPRLQEIQDNLLHGIMHVKPPPKKEEQ